jgi:hypothetical protein
MSQPPGLGQGSSEQDDPHTVPQVERHQPPAEPHTVPQIPQHGPQPTPYGPHWQPGYGSPRRRNTAAWVVLGGGLLVVGLVLTLVFTLTSGPDRDTPEGVAEAVADVFNDHDFEELTTLSCADDKETVAETVDMLTGFGSEFGATATVDDVDPVGDDRAVAELMLTYTKVPNELRGVLDVGDKEDVNLELAEENGEWCLASFSGQAR